VDEWAETVPDAEQTTSLAFHYDAPTSAAPNVWLLGVLPPPRETWDGPPPSPMCTRLSNWPGYARSAATRFPFLASSCRGAGLGLHPGQPGLDVTRLTAPPEA